MIHRLAEGPASVSELARPLQMTLAAVLQHVQVLEASGLVESRKTGRVRTCSINGEALRSTEQWLTDRRTVWQRRFDRLGAVLDEQVRSEQAHQESEQAHQESEQAHQEQDTPPATRKRGRRT